ncbi:hypothetical protein E3E31_11855 [Thermococcus sp. M39]|uniref:hypothetical protein n=1 Tax=unclassified Thermococcus TaxID=2627626 RepID=UPI00143B3377|nr:MULTISPECIES: hypothetical protein [unclassified Thermococcus]NJE09202.1 hypothetical protein [Thermococcus sp. M39]NJE13762.1 hypothetical protein [Thermococcus sp. LS2]
MEKYSLLALFLISLVFVSGCIGGVKEKVIEGAKEKVESVAESYSKNQTYTESPSEDTSTAEETTEYATWTDPWDLTNPIKIGGDSYIITYIKYKLKVRTEQGGEIYEYEVEKRRGKTKIHVYGIEIDFQTGETKKVDLGEFEVYEYYGKVAPIKGKEMDKPLEVISWSINRSDLHSEFFAYPVVIGLGIGGPDIVGLKVAYGDKIYEAYNPFVIEKMDYNPYTEGDLDWYWDISDVEDMYIAFFSMAGFGIWDAFTEENLYEKSSGSWGYLNYQYNYEIDPDGTVKVGGKSFKVSNVKWSYTIGDTQGQGRAVLAANLPIPLETEGVFISQGTNIYTYIKVEDLGFEKI